MKAEVVPAVMDVARQAAEPAAAESTPDQQADRGDQQAGNYQKFSKLVHGANGIPPYLLLTSLAA